jgi:hypothetical protein
VDSLRTCEHEAAHAAMTIWQKRRVSYVERYGGSFLPGEVAGHCRSPIEGEIGGDQLLIALAGRMAVEEEGWPPKYREAHEEPREALATLIRILDLDCDAYDQLVELAHEILADEHFRRLHAAITRALRVVPRLDEQAVRELAPSRCHPHPRTDRSA